MIREFLGSAIRWLTRAVTQPREELNRWQRAARFAYDLGRYGARQLSSDRAPQMAAALAFRTLFGLAPVLLVGTILVKSLGGTDAILSAVRDLLVSAGLDQVHIVPPAGAPDSTAASISLAEWLENLIEQLTSTNLSTIGWVGFLLIAYAAIGLMFTIENSFNIIYRAPEGRPWTRRVPLYWFILTVGPAVLGTASYVNGQFDRLIEAVDTWQGLLLAGRVLWSLVVIWLFMFAVYALVPNSHVNWKSATTGAFVAALLLETGKHFMGMYLGKAFSINQLYGSLGLIPLFMFWVYLMWLAILFGLQVSATLQMLQGRSLDEIDQKKGLTGLIDSGAVLTVMEMVAERFASGNPPTTREIADAVSLSEPIIVRIVERLVEEGLLHRLERPDGAISLARPADHVTADQLIEIGFSMVDESCAGRRSALLQRLRDAQTELAASLTLAALASDTSRRH